jgi:hypothetical protein
MAEFHQPHEFSGLLGKRCEICYRYASHKLHWLRQNEPLARVLLERAQDGYVNPTGGKTTGRERRDA